MLACHQDVDISLFVIVDAIRTFRLDEIAIRMGQSVFIYERIAGILCERNGIPINLNVGGCCGGCYGKQADDRQQNHELSKSVHSNAPFGVICSSDRTGVDGFSAALMGFIGRDRFYSIRFYHLVKKESTYFVKITRLIVKITLAEAGRTESGRLKPICMRSLCRPSKGTQSLKPSEYWERERFWEKAAGIARR